MVIWTSEYLNQRLAAQYSNLLCRRVALYKKGKTAPSEEVQVVELGFLRQFSPYWDSKFIKEVDCYINGRSN